VETFLKKYGYKILAGLFIFGAISYYYMNQKNEVERTEKLLLYITTIECSSVPINDLDHAISMIQSTIYDSSKFENGVLKSKDSIDLRFKLDQDLENIQQVKFKVERLVEIDKETNLRQRAIHQIERCEEFITHLAYAVLADLSNDTTVHKDPMEMLNQERDVIVRIMSSFIKVLDTWKEQNKISDLEPKGFQHPCR
jgi:hypothetical protein